MIWVVSALVVIAIGVVARAALRQQLNLDALPNAVGSTPAASQIPRFRRPFPISIAKGTDISIII